MKNLASDMATYQPIAFVATCIFQSFTVLAATFPSVMTADLRALPGSISTPHIPVITPSCAYNTFPVPKLIEQRNENAVDFKDITGYSLLHVCAQICLDGWSVSDRVNVWNFADCKDNECACLADTQPTVVQSLSSCQSADCSNTAYLVRATSVYALFCSSVTGAPTAEMPTASENKIITIVSTTTFVTSTSSSSSEYRFLLLASLVRFTGSVTG